MRKLVLSVALAALLTGASGLASAISPSNDQTFDAGVLGATWVDFSHSSINGRFIDTITFSLAGPSDFSYHFFGTLGKNGSGSFNHFAVTLDGVSLNVDAFAATSKKNGSASGSDDFLLGAGIQHHIVFNGVGTGNGGGSYDFHMSALPVPEPESYAMLLAGLGLMGTIARRRSKSSRA